MCSRRRNARTGFDWAAVNVAPLPSTLSHHSSSDRSCPSTQVSVPWWFYLQSFGLPEGHQTWSELFLIININITWSEGAEERWSFCCLYDSETPAQDNSLNNTLSAWLDWFSVHAWTPCINSKTLRVWDGLGVWTSVCGCVCSVPVGAGSLSSCSIPGDRGAQVRLCLAEVVFFFFIFDWWGVFVLLKHSHQAISSLHRDRKVTTCIGKWGVLKSRLKDNKLILTHCVLIWWVSLWFY